MAEKQTHNIKTVLTFLVPSIIGLLLFMTPISYQDAITIPIAIVSKGLQNLLGDSIVAIVTAIVVLTAIATLICKAAKPTILNRYPFFRALLDVSPMWALVRVLGAIFIVLTFTGTGPEAIHSGNTGALVLNDLLPVLF